MQKRLLVSVVVIALAAMMIGFSTVAYWTSQASNNGNTFTTGTLIIGSPNAGTNTGTWEADNIYPGWSDTHTIAVKNLGTIPFDYQVTATRNGGSADLYNLLMVQVVGSSSGTIYDGPLSGLNNADAAATLQGNDGVAGSGSDEETLTITMSLPDTVTNTDLDPSVSHSTTVDFTFDAEQHH